LIGGPSNQSKMMSHTKNRLFSVPVFSEIPEMPPIDLTFIQDFLKYVPREQEMQFLVTPIITPTETTLDTSEYEIVVTEPVYDIVPERISLEQPPPLKTAPKRGHRKLFSMLGLDFDSSSVCLDDPQHHTLHHKREESISRDHKEDSPSTPGIIAKSLSKLKIPNITGHHRKGTEDSHPVVERKQSNNQTGNANSPGLLHLRDSPSPRMGRSRKLSDTPLPVSPDRISLGISPTATGNSSFSLGDRTTPDHLSPRDMSTLIATPREVTSTPRGFFGMLKHFISGSPHPSVDDHPTMIEGMVTVSSPEVPEGRLSVNSRQDSDDEEEEEIEDWDTFPVEMPNHDRRWYLGLY
jgi:hypothetical protein